MRAEEIPVSRERMAEMPRKRRKPRIIGGRSSRVKLEWTERDFYSLGVFGRDLRRNT